MSKKVFVIIFSIGASNLILMLLGIMVILLFGTDILCYIGMFGSLLSTIAMLIAFVVGELRRQKSEKDDNARIIR